MLARERAVAVDRGVATPGFRTADFLVVSTCVYRPVRLHETCMRVPSSCTRSPQDPADDVVMEAEWEQRPVFPVRSCRRRSSLEDRLIARMLAPWLDGELARGLGTSLSEAHAARAAQLTTKHTRRAVAVSLDRLVDRAENPRRGFLTWVVQPCPEQVLEAVPLIVSIRSRLRSTEPLNAEAVARLKSLLSDRAGPCYVRSDPGALSAALRDVSEALEVEH